VCPSPCQILGLLEWDLKRASSSDKKLSVLFREHQGIEHPIFGFLSAPSPRQQSIQMSAATPLSRLEYCATESAETDFRSIFEPAPTGRRDYFRQSRPGSHNGLGCLMVLGGGTRLQSRNIRSFARLGSRDCLGLKIFSKPLPSCGNIPTGRQSSISFFWKTSQPRAIRCSNTWAWPSRSS